MKGAGSVADAGDPYRPNAADSPSFPPPFPPVTQTTNPLHFIRLRLFVYLFLEREREGRRRQRHLLAGGGHSKSISSPIGSAR